MKEIRLTLNELKNIVKQVIIEESNLEIKKENKSYAEVAMKSFGLRDQIQIFHWQTMIGSQHEALGSFYDDFLGLLDQLIEFSMGKYGRFSVSGVNLPKLNDLSETNLDSYLKEHIDYYTKIKKTLFSNDDSALNILDEIIGELNKLKYLVSMS